MSTRPLLADDERSDEVPVTPSVEAWRKMTRAERDAHILAVHDALNAQRDLMSEGRPHFTAKIGAITVLGDFFQRVGKTIYLAAELPVLYPGESAFSPDIIAVRDVEDLGEGDGRMAWSVAEEGRGPDLVMEILVKGDRDKDLVSNVARYARLGIPEFFVYDRLNQRLYGYRLSGQAPRRYESIPFRGGRLGSAVLELDLRIVEGRLRFFYGEAQVPESRELIGRLDAMLDQRERQIEEEAAARQQAERRVAIERESLRETERRAEEAERRAEEEAAARQEAERRAEAAEARLAQLNAELEALRRA